MPYYNSFLEVRNVTMIIPNTKKFELNQVNVSFPEKGIYFITGRNGNEGLKFLSIISGLNKPDSGEILFSGTSIYKTKKSYLETYRNKIASIVFKDNGLMETQSVQDNLILAYKLTNHKSNPDNIKQALSKAGLPNSNGFLSKTVSQLSEDEKKRVAIARALVKDVKILIVENPSFPKKEPEKKIYEILKELSKSILVIVSSSNKEIIDEYSDGTVTFTNGQCSDMNFCRKDESQHSDFRMPKNKHLPIMDIFRFGLHSFYAKKIKYAITFVLTLVLFSGLGITFISQTSKKIEPLVSMLYDNSIEDVILSDENVLIENRALDPEILLRKGFSEKQLIAINNEIPEKEQIRVYNNYALKLKVPNNSTFFDFEKNITYDLLEWEQTEKIETAYTNTFYENFHGFMEMDEESFEYTGFSLDKRIQNKAECHLPSKYDECAISGFKANLYLEKGYRDENGNIVSLKNLDDLIGRKLDNFTITAIYETREDRDLAKKHSFESPNNKAEKLENDKYCDGTYINNYLYLKKGTLDNFEKNNDWKQTFAFGLFYHLPENKASCLSLLNKMTYAYKDEDGVDFKIRPNLLSPVTSVVDSARVFQSGTLINIYIAVLVIFLIFDLLLVISLFSHESKRERKERYILLSSGASKKDLLFIILSKSFLFSFPALILSIIPIEIICVIKNSGYLCKFLLFKGLPVLYLFLSAFCFSIIISFIPFMRLLRKKSIDIINEKND